MDDRPRYYKLEEPAYLGREYPADPDSYRHHPRHASAGSLLFLDLLLLFAAIAYTAEGAWVVGLICGIAAMLCAVPAYRWLKQLVREEREADPSETLRSLVRPRPGPPTAR